MSFFHLLTPKRKHLFWASYAVSVVVVALIGALGGLLFGYAIDLPQVEKLQEVRPNIVSYVYSDDGRILGQFALEKRVLVSYDQIPETLMNAILSTEDASFLEHSGIDFRRLFVAAVRDIVLGERKGASTLTMQLSKLLFTSSEKTIERKIKDMLFALEIEKNYSKEQIFTFYCNQIYMGHGTFLTIRYLKTSRTPSCRPRMRASLNIPVSTLDVSLWLQCGTLFWAKERVLRPSQCN